MIRGRAQIDKTNRLGETALIVAVQQRHRAIVSTLLKLGANPDKADHAAGYTARDYAKRDSRSKEMLTLIETVKSQTSADSRAGQGQLGAEAQSRVDLRRQPARRAAREIEPFGLAPRRRQRAQRRFAQHRGVIAVGDQQPRLAGQEMLLVEQARTATAAPPSRSGRNNRDSRATCRRRPDRRG